MCPVKHCWQLAVVTPALFAVASHADAAAVVVVDAAALVVVVDAAALVVVVDATAPVLVGAASPETQ